MNIKNEFKELITNIKIMFKEFFNKDTNIKQRANMLTFTRLIMAPFIPILALLGKISLGITGYVLASLVTLLSTATDFFDGKLARKYHNENEYGKKLDIIADKIFSITISISLSIINPIFLLNLLGELTIATTNIIYKSKYSNISINSNIIGKIKQWPLSISFILGFISIITKAIIPINNTFIILSFILQLLTCEKYIHNNQKQINNQDIEEYYQTSNKLDNLPKKEITNSKIQELKKLRNVLLEIIKSQNNSNNNIKEKNKTLKK